MRAIQDMLVLGLLLGMLALLKELIADAGEDRVWMVSSGRLKWDRTWRVARGKSLEDDRQTGQAGES